MMLELGIIIVCAIFSFFYSGVETGLLLLDRGQLRSQARKQKRSALILQGFINQPEKVLTTVLVANTIVNVSVTILLTMFLMNRFGIAGYWLTWFVLGSYLLVSELLSKSLFSRFPLRTSLLTAPLLSFSFYTMYPFIAFFSGLTRLLLQAAGSRNAQQDLFVKREELKFRMRESEGVFNLSPDQHQLIGGVFDLRLTTVRDIMIPISDVAWVGPKTSTAQVVRQAKQTHFSRYPVLDHLGKPVGVVNVLEVVFSGKVNEETQVSDFMHKAVVTMEEERIDRTLKRMQATREMMQIVQNRRQVVVGIVTITDVLNKLTGGAKV